MLCLHCAVCVALYCILVYYVELGIVCAVVLHFILASYVKHCVRCGRCCTGWFPIVLLYMCIVSGLCGMCLVVLGVALSYLSVMCCAYVLCSIVCATCSLLLALAVFNNSCLSVLLVQSCATRTCVLLLVYIVCIACISCAVSCSTFIINLSIR